MTLEEAHRIARECGHKCVADFNTSGIFVDDWQPSMTLGEFMAFATGLAEKKFKVQENRSQQVIDIVAQLKKYADVFSGRAGKQCGCGWVCAQAALMIEEMSDQIAVRDWADCHANCDREIQRLTSLLHDTEKKRHER